MAKAFHEIKVHNKIILLIRDENGRPWFKGKDIANLLGYIRTADAIRDNVSHTNKKILGELLLQPRIKFTQRNMQRNTIFINKEGLIQIITASQMPNIGEIAKTFGIKNTYRYIKKEIEIVDVVTIFLNELDIKFHTQKAVNKYRIDLYIPKYKLAIEIDEHNHSGRDKKHEKIRQTQIENILDCQFLRYNPDAKNFNINYVTAQIAKHILHFHDN